MNGKFLKMKIGSNYRDFNRVQHFIILKMLTVFVIISYLSSTGIETGILICKTENFE